MKVLKSALVLGTLGLLAGVLGVVASWNKPELGPRWYSVAVAAIALPSAWAGAWLHGSRGRAA